VISTVLGGAGDKVEPMDPESARALCALILAGIFSTRTAKDFGLVWKRSKFRQLFLSCRGTDGFVQAWLRS
jgi:hypothetical protein